MTKAEVYIGSFDVRPVDTRKHKWKGAFVYCHVVAKDARAAGHLIRRAFKEDGYRVILCEFYRKHSEAEWFKPKAAKRAKLLAKKAQESSGVVYDDFCCYRRK